jgi:RND superfamily putative drug exporter
MLTRFAKLATGRPRWVLAGALLLLVLAGAIGGGVAERLTTGGFEDPDAESSLADEVLDEQFGSGAANVVLLVTAEGGDVDAPDVAAAGQALTDELAAEPGLTNVVSYWSEGNAPPLASEAGDRALVVGRIDASEDELDERITELAPRYEGADGVVDVAVGGSAQVFHEIAETLERDLLRAELIALPITLVLLVLIFGSVVSATLPLVTGVLSIMGTFLVLRAVSEVTEVSVYALNLTTALGLGLAIDYSLFIVSRFREELAAGHDRGPAVVRTVRTAGRTVAFSALTVAASLLATLVFPVVFLRSFAYAGVAVALLAGLFSVLVLPALLYLLGHRVNALSVRRRAITPPSEGVWHRVATFVMRRPVPVATAAIALLLLLGAPFLGLRLTQPDDRVLPPDAPSREVGDVLRDEFDADEVAALAVVAPDAGGTDDATIDAYAAELATLPSVSRVDAATGTYCGEGVAEQFGCEPGQLVLGPDSADRYAGYSAGGGTYLSVVPSVEPYSAEAETLVDDIRDADAPFAVQVTGMSASHVDINNTLFDRLPLAIALIALITVVLLFMMFGSIVIPAKAIVLNLLSLSATFGAMVWVFQEGHLSGVLDFTATGGLAAAMPILMFCVAFGLSMDYEVFLLSRIKEEHDRGADSVTSVARGLERTGRIVTAAAVLISVVFVAFALGDVSFMKLFGLGLTAAVLLDAFLIRGTLVPAFMRLAGEWNWWAPGPLRRFHDRWGISEHVDLDDDEDGATPPTRDPSGSTGPLVVTAVPVPPSGPASSSEPVTVPDGGAERHTVGVNGSSSEAR